MKEKQSNLQDAIYRNLQENATYAYEILVEDNSGLILIVPRTNNIEAFNENMKSAKDIVNQDGGNIKVDIYRGKSPKAGLVTRYNIDLEENRNAEKPVSNLAQIEQAVDMAIKKYQLNNNIGGLGSIENFNLLFGALTGNDADKENNGNSLSGLAGLLGAVNNSRYENSLMQFEKKFSDYKQETELNSLKKQLLDITSERDTLKKQNQELEKANSEYRTEVSELETRLAGYSNTELLKRVATGVLSGIGSKILGNNPKAAELMGLSKDELQAALGFVEEDEELHGHSSIIQHDVDVEEMPIPKTEQQKQIFNAINDTAKALKQSDIQFAIYMITIIGNCMESKELTKSMVQHLEKEKQRLSIEEDDESAGKEE